MVELITNGGFDSEEGWTLTGLATIAGGNLQFGKALGTAEQENIFENGSTYTLTFTLILSALSNAETGVYNGSNKDELIGTIPALLFEQNLPYSFTFTATSATSDGSLFFEKELGAEGENPVHAVYIDDVSVIGPASVGATHIQRIWTTGVIHNQEVRSFMSMIQVVFEQGTGLSTGQGSDPQVMMQWSDDGGKTWSNGHWRGIGAIGEYAYRTIWRRLGNFRSRIFRFIISDPIKVAVISAHAK